MSYDFEKEIMEKRKNILKTMKNYINNELNSSKKKIMIRKEVTFKKPTVLKK